VTTVRHMHFILSGAYKRAVRWKWVNVSGRLVRGDLKTHQQRRVALDPETVTVLTEHRDRCQARAEALELSLDKDAFVFSPELDGSRFLAPSSLTQRYDRLAERLGIDTTFHKLRHYSATELIAAGVDVRTVAGRLGHAGGGTTTLRAYTAWVSEADQRAAKNIGGRMPERPVPGQRATRSAPPDTTTSNSSGGTGASNHSLPCL
jgi:integrase